MAKDNPDPRLAGMALALILAAESLIRALDARLDNNAPPGFDYSVDLLLARAELENLIKKIRESELLRP